MTALPTVTRFNFNAKRAFLTYAQCPLHKERVYNFINSKYPIKYAVISTELHQDGNTHLHCAIEFTKKVHCRSQAVFDVEGYHPNIQNPKNWPATLNYVKKAGDYEEYNVTEDDDDDDLYDLANIMSKREFMEYCRKNRVPHAYAREAWESADSLFTIREDYVENPEATVISGLNSLDISEDTRRRKCIVLIGPSGCGKTTFAKRIAAKPALFVTHVDGLKQLRREHRAIIFDDMCFTHWSHESQIKITDKTDPQQIHIRYGTATIPSGIEKYFTANREIFEDDPAITRRTYKIYCNTLQPIN